jgi:hypothetical protein
MFKMRNVENLIDDVLVWVPKGIPYNDTVKTIEEFMKDIKIAQLSEFIECAAEMTDIVNKAMTMETITYHDLAKLYMIKYSLGKFIDRHPYRGKFIRQYFETLEFYTR